MSYIDKVVFYRNQFVRCGQAMAFRPTRGNNLDAIVESRFVDNDGPAIELTYGNAGTMIASCAFENNDADPIVIGPATVLNSLFVADRGRSMVGPAADIEGCTFWRGTSTRATIFTNIVPGYLAGVARVNVVHCDSDMPLGAVEESAPIAGLYLDNAMPADEPFQSLMTVLDYRTQHTQDVADDTRAIHTILTGESSPGSRLLFSRAE